MKRVVRHIHHPRGSSSSGPGCSTVLQRITISRSSMLLTVSRRHFRRRTSIVTTAFGSSSSFSFSSMPAISFFSLRQKHTSVCGRRRYHNVTETNAAAISTSRHFHRTQASFFTQISTSRRNHQSRNQSTSSEQQSNNNNIHSNREWHGPSFMSTSSSTEKEQWLESILQKQEEELMKQQQQHQRRDGLISDYAVDTDIARDNPSSETDIKRPPASSPSSTTLVDAEAFLVVLRSLTGTTGRTEQNKSPSNPRRAEYWMKRMKDQQQIQPTPECYQCVIQAWANSSNTEEPLVVVNRSERWLREMSDPLSFSPPESGGSERNNSNSNSDRAIMPTIGCYNAYLDACTRGRQMKTKHSKQILVDNSLKAESILRKLVSLSFHHNVLPTTLHPTTATFNYVIRGISRCKDDDTIADRILVLVRMMEGFQKRSIQQGNRRRRHFDPPCPNTKTYAMVMDSLISVGRMKARRHHNDTMAYGGHNNLPNNNNSAYHVDFDDPEYGDYDYYTNDVDEDGNDISGSNSNSVDNSNNNGLKEMEEAAAILQYMHDLYDAGIPNIVPNRVPYNILITGWAGLASFGVGGSASKKGKSTSSSYKNNNHNEFDNEMESSQYYDGVTWYCDSAPFKAEEILRTMMSHGDDYNNNGSSIFGQMFGGDPSGMEGQDTGSTPRLGFRNRKCPDATPDRISYEKVILAWGNSGHPNAGKRALWWLKQLWSETENAEMSMTDNSMQISSKHFPTRVDELCPTVATYNTVMKALVSSPECGGALAAENLLLDLGEKCRSLSPSSSSEELKNCYGRLRPNSESFAIVIRAWLRESYEVYGADNRVACLTRAVEWLSSLHDVEKENDLSTAPELFTGVLKAANRCARDRPDIMGIAVEIFETYRDSRFRYDGQCYSTMLQVGLQAYSGSGREQDRGEFVNKLVKECCEDGLLNSVFVRTIANHHSYECRAVTHKYFQHWPLATSWSRNVKNRNNVPTPRDLRPYNEHSNVRRRSDNLRRRQQNNMGRY